MMILKLNMELATAKKILIVDDEPDVIEFLSYNFKRMGYIVECAFSGVEGVDKVKSFDPDIVITDIMMPAMDGIMMSKIIRDEMGNKRLPVIFLSAVQDDYVVLNAGLNGDEFISKPVKFTLLLPAVEKLLKVA